MRAIRESGLPGLDRHILMNLVSLADPATCVIPDRFMPSLTELADQMGWGRSTIARRIPELEKVGWLKRTTPSLQAAWKDKEKNSYALLIPVSTSPGAGLVPERDQSRSGTSPGAGLEKKDTSSELGTSPGAGLVPERDGTSPGAGHEVPDLRTKKTSPSERFAETRTEAEANAGTILADFIDYCSTKQVKIPKRIIGHYAKTIKECLDDKFNERIIKIALAGMLDDKVINRPSLLPNRLVAAQTGPERYRQERRNGQLGNQHQPYLDPEDQSVYDRPL